MARVSLSRTSIESHHALFTRREWRHAGLNYVRNLPALIQRTSQVNHVLLHAVIEPPKE